MVIKMQQECAVGSPSRSQCTGKNTGLSRNPEMQGRLCVNYMEGGPHPTQNSPLSWRSSLYHHFPGFFILFNLSLRGSWSRRAIKSAAVEMRQ